MHSLKTGLLLVSALILFSTGALAVDDFLSGFELPEEATYVGSETCLDCHDDIGSFYAHSPHSVEKRLTIPGTDIASCEACHGPGSIHVEDEDVEAIVNIEMMAGMSDAQHDLMCRQCHIAVHHGYTTGPHGGPGISCADCHGDQVHYAVAAKPAVEFRNETEFCLQCHTDSAVDFRLPSRHRVLENEMTCGDCHDPHRGFPTAGWNGLNDSCLACHTEMAGPFIFEHDGVQGEDCTVCHKPHGSMHDKLLVADGNTLCLQCHYETTFNQGDGFEIGGVNHRRMLDNGMACFDCHTEIHGSNVAPAFRDQ